MHYQVAIVGGGPAGLSCSRVLAEQGISVILFERKKKFGPKVCAGGITWSGLIQRVPEELIEKSFPRQSIITPLQQAEIREKQPIIATVNREKLGQFMAHQARVAGAELKPGCRVGKINKKRLTYRDQAGKDGEISYEFLIGADGATSIVRNYLGLQTMLTGIGINYQVQGFADEMEWHLNHKMFNNGYGWIFPHSSSVSVGGYVTTGKMAAKTLKANLISWGKSHNYKLENEPSRAELINYDYQGWNFGNTFLIGEAAGLTSGLTGEGIYPAIVSGEIIGKYIADSTYNLDTLNRLIKIHRLHTKVVTTTAKHKLLSTTIAELVTLGLRSGLIDYKKLEMAH